jgi:hypothetical protein
MAANNNLYKFAIQNFTQMIKVGSSPFINIIVQIDSLGEKEITRFYIEKNNASAIYTQADINGTPDSLYNFVKWCSKNFPAEHQALVLWNHGSGIKDPSIWGKVLLGHRDQLFVKNTATGKLELNRKLARQKPAYIPEQEKGIAFNENFETYLTNQDLKNILDKLSQEVLGGQKFDLLCMDACHMSMLEVASQIKNSTRIMVGSEEVEPGGGYNYLYLLSPLQDRTLTPDDFARLIVKSYEKEYAQGYDDFTQSATDLNYLTRLEENFGKLSATLLTLISSSDGTIFSRTLKELRSNAQTTIEFYDQDYIDLGQFYRGLFVKLENLRAKKEWPSIKDRVEKTVNSIKNLCMEGFSILHNMVLEHVTGGNLTTSSGLSFYFPTKDIHNSYYKTVFDNITHWSDFLKKYIAATKTQPKTKPAQA